MSNAKKDSHIRFGLSNTAILHYDKKQSLFLFHVFS